MPDHPTQLILATTNPGKISELRESLRGCTLEIIGLADLPGIKEVAESGVTFAENADLKARGYALQTGKAALADDSGLEVAALGGRPGVLSARYGGDNVGYADKIRKLLDEIRSSGNSDRSARFVCAMSVASPSGHILHRAYGVCHGNIAYEPLGEHGFGYDPVFIPEGHELTFGQLADSVKGKISHRARAIREIIPFLRHFIID